MRNFFFLVDSKEAFSGEEAIVWVRTLSSGKLKQSWACSQACDDNFPCIANRIKFIYETGLSNKLSDGNYKGASCLMRSVSDELAHIKNLTHGINLGFATAKSDKSCERVRHSNPNPNEWRWFAFVITAFPPMMSVNDNFCIRKAIRSFYRLPAWGEQNKWFVVWRFTFYVRALRSALNCLRSRTTTERECKSHENALLYHWNEFNVHFKHVMEWICISAQTTRHLLD